MNLAQLNLIVFLASLAILFYPQLRHRLALGKRVPRSEAEAARHESAPGKLATQIKTHDRGVQLTRADTKNEKKTDIDIIAIHGLDTNSPKTWEWQAGDQKVNWLARPDMLPKMAERARIFYCDWPADLYERSDLVQKEVDEIALLLLAGIKRRPLTTNDLSKNDRPILFVASCLGGVLLMKALVNARNNDEYLAVTKATRGIIFLATPFRGTSFQEVADWAEPALKVSALYRCENLSRLLGETKPNFDLEKLVQQFTALCRGESYQVVNFYELGKTSLPRKVFPWLPISFAQEKPLVGRSSATLDIVQNPLPLNRPHVKMNKFEGPKDPDYECVAGKIQELLTTIRKNSPLEQADACIRNERYAPHLLEIERLSGTKLSMDQCYINLTIVKQSAGNTSRSQEENTTQRASQFSLFARLKVDTPDEKSEVALSELFNPRKERDGHTKQPRRVLIRGRAGVGKTTLCKKVIHDFKYGKLWQHLFDRLLWVPLRNLKLEERRRIAGYNFGHLFRDEYFSQHLRGEALAMGLWDTIKTTERTLFILDGLDEVSQDLGGGMLRFLEELLNQPNVMITSRPQTRLPAGLNPVDLELETIGFYPDQVNDYLQKAFVDDRQKVNEIQSFLRERPLMQSLVRIPIQLDALCYTWESFRGTSIPQTMTAIYNKIEENLWKKDAVNMDKEFEGEVVRRSDIKNANMKKMEKIIGKELYFLEGLAFTGMYNDAIDFDSESQNDISEEFPFRDKTIFPDKTLLHLSFLRPSDPSPTNSNQTYHFLHLTFQEYFAARYFVRQWLDGQALRYLKLGPSRDMKETDPIEFLHEHKYHARYDIFWRFVSGLLASEGSKGNENVQRFFNAIEEEPLDLLGPTHQRLIMHCLSEVPSEMNLPCRPELEDCLKEWLLFEYSYRGKVDLAREMEFPEHALDAAFSESSDDMKRAVLWKVSKRAGLPNTILETAASWLHHDGDYNVRRAAVEVLSGRSDLPDGVLEVLAAKLDDGDANVRYTAVQVLGGRSDLPDGVLEVLAAKLDDGDARVRGIAVDVLCDRSDLPDGMLEVLAAKLDDGDARVRYTAVHVLGGRSDLPDGVLEVLAAKLDDGDARVRDAAVDVLGGRSDLPDGVLEVLAAKLDDGDAYVRGAALDVLGGRSDLPDGMLEVLAAKLDDGDAHVRYTAVQVLGDRSDLPGGVLEVLAAKLDDGDADVRGAALDVLGGRSDLPDGMLEVLAAKLDDGDAHVRYTAVQVLCDRSDLPDGVLEVLAAKLDDGDARVRGIAVDVLGGRSDLPDGVLEVLAAKLDDGDAYVRGIAVDVLGGRSDLPGGVLEVLAAKLDDGDADVRDAAVKVILQRLEKFFDDILSENLVASFYRGLLRLSFAEQLSWYINGNDCCINMPEGIKTLPMSRTLLNYDQLISLGCVRREGRLGIYPQHEHLT